MEQLSLGVVADREECYPDPEEHQHVEGQDLDFTEGLRYFYHKKSHSEAPRTQWGAVTDLFLHMMMWACSVCACL